MKEYGFSALIARMSYIYRWGLMRNTRSESLAEHSLFTATTAHILGLIAKEIYNADLSPERIATAALYHDLSETMTGDLPTPIKYRNETLKREYKAVEQEAVETISDMLPDEIKGEVKQIMSCAQLNEREKAILKSADKISALVKCIEEEQSGNTEFLSAKQATLKLLEQSELPETRYFLKHFIPSFSKNLDNLLKNQ